MSDEPSTDLDTLHARLIEVFRKALLIHHTNDWDMETCAEAAHVCASVIINGEAAGLLADVAIGRGELEDTGFAQARGQFGQWAAVYACSVNWNPDEHGHDRLYRVVEP